MTLQGLKERHGGREGRLNGARDYSRRRRETQRQSEVRSTNNFMEAPTEAPNAKRYGGTARRHGRPARKTAGKDTGTRNGMGSHVEELI